MSVPAGKDAQRFVQLDAEKGLIVCELGEAVENEAKEAVKGAKDAVVLHVPSDISDLPAQLAELALAAAASPHFLLACAIPVLKYAQMRGITQGIDAVKTGIEHLLAARLMEHGSHLRTAGTRLMRSCVVGNVRVCGSFVHSSQKFASGDGYYKPK